MSVVVLNIIVITTPRNLGFVKCKLHTMTTKDKAVLIFLFNKVRILNEEIRILKKEREELLETAKNSMSKKRMLRIVH